MSERDTRKVISKKIHHRDCDITQEDIANAKPEKMPRVTPEQHRERTEKHAAEEDDQASQEDDE